MRGEITIPENAHLYPDGPPAANLHLHDANLTSTKKAVYRAKLHSKPSLVQCGPINHWVMLPFALTQPTLTEYPGGSPLPDRS